MKWTLIPAFIGTAVLASAATVLYLGPEQGRTMAVGVPQHNRDDGQLLAAITDLHGKLQLLDARIEGMENARGTALAASHTVAAEPGQGEAEPGMPPKMVMVNPTPEENAIFAELKQQLEEPRFVQSLNFNQLINSEEMAALPEPLRMVIISRAIAKFNKGEVEREVFLGDMK